MDDQLLLECITLDPEVMTGKPVINGTRLTGAYVVNLLAHGTTEDEILEAPAAQLSQHAAEDVLGADRANSFFQSLLLFRISSSVPPASCFELDTAPLEEGADGGDPRILDAMDVCEVAPRVFELDDPSTLHRLLQAGPRLRCDRFSTSARGVSLKHCGKSVFAVGIEPALELLLRVAEHPCKLAPLQVDVDFGRCPPSAGEASCVDR